MGVAIPRPAMRAREARIIKARLDHYDKRYKEFVAAGEPQANASAKAFSEAKALQFNRAGKVK